MCPPSARKKKVFYINVMQCSIAFSQKSLNILGQRQVNVVFLLQPEEDLDAPNPVEEQMLIYLQGASKKLPLVVLSFLINTAEASSPFSLSPFAF